MFIRRMSLLRKISILTLPLVFHSQVFAQSEEVIRRQGFAEHQKDAKQFDKARESGEQAYYEEQQIWELSKNRDLEEFKRQKKSVDMADDGPEAKKDALEKQEYEREYEKTRKAYAAQLEKKSNELAKQLGTLQSEETEYGLNEDRPRFDYKKRQMFGGKPVYKKGFGSSSGSSGGASGGFSPSSGGDSFPPPPSFDDFSNDGFPSPSGDDFSGEIPAPVPVPSFEDEGNFNENDFPPPPPPPPPLEGESIDFGGGDF